MKLSSIFLCLIPLAFADPATVLADLTTLQKSIKTLNGTLNSFADNAKQIPGNTLVKLQNQNTALSNQVRKLTKDTKASAAFTGSEAKKIIAAVLNLQPTTFSLLDNLVAHKQAFANSGVTSIVVQDLKSEQNAVATLGPALQAKVPKQYKSQAPVIEKNFNTHFNDAISALQS